VITLSLPRRKTHPGHVEAKGDRVNFQRRSPQKRGQNSTPLHTPKPQQSRCNIGLEAARALNGDVLENHHRLRIVMVLGARSMVPRGRSP